MMRIRMMMRIFNIPRAIIFETIHRLNVIPLDTAAEEATEYLVHFVFAFVT